MNNAIYLPTLFVNYTLNRLVFVYVDTCIEIHYIKHVRSLFMRSMRYDKVVLTNCNTYYMYFLYYPLSFGNAALQT